MDDASTDEAPALIARFVDADRRIQTVRHEINRRLPAALNTGFAQARGDYLTWTSDDNCYRPDALAEMAAFLDAHPTVGAVYSDYTVIDEGGHPIEYQKRVGMPEELVVISCVGACFLYRRAVQEKVGEYAEHLYLAEDYDFWLRASQSFRLQPLHKDLYLYRRHTASLTHLQTERIRVSATQALERNLPLMAWLDSSQRARGYLHLAELYRVSNPRKSRRNVLRAFLCSPAVAMGNRDLRAATKRDIVCTLRRLLGRVGRGPLRYLKRRFRAFAK